MKVIDRYITGTVLRTSGLMVLVVCALSAVSSFLGEANNYVAGDYTTLQLLALIVLEIPKHLHVVMPVVALLGALMGLGGLATHSELVVLRASGLSVGRLGWSVARAGLVVAIATALLGEFLAPVTARLAEHSALTGNEGVQSIQGSLWVREDQRMIRIDRILSKKVLTDITVYRGVQDSGDGSGLKFIMRAESARYVDSQWILHDVRTSVFRGNQVDVRTMNRKVWDIGLEPSYLRLSVTETDELSSLGLYHYSNYLQKNNVAAEKYRMAMWRNLVMPFMVLVLTILALPFSFGALRGAGVGQRLLVGGAAGLGFFMFNEIAVSTSQVYGLPAWLAASWPTILLAILTAWWFRRMR